MTTFFRKFKRAFNRATVTALVIFSIAVAILFSDWIVLQSKHIQAFYYVYQGDKKFKVEHLQEAIDYYNKALKLYPGHVKAQYNLGNIYATYEDFLSASICYEKALAYKPDYINARINLAIIQESEFHNDDKAITEYKNATLFKPKVIKIPYFYDNEEHVNKSIAIAYYNLGNTYRAKAMHFERKNVNYRKYLALAIKSYKESLKYNDKHPYTHYNLGLAAQAIGIDSTAMQGYCSSMRLDPLSYESHYNLAVLLIKKKKYKLALKELKKAKVLATIKNSSNRDEFLTYLLQKHNVPHQDIRKSFEMLEIEERDEYFRNLIDNFQIPLEEIEAIEQVVLNQEESYKEAHITGVLTDAYQQNEPIVSSKIKKLFKDKPPVKMYYKNGKVLISEDFDEMVKKNFSVCSCKELLED